jgi:dipeptidyl aminopeptidase/acylaminoacyl peptidase
VTLREPRLAGGLVYWLEQRPTEGGRTVLVRLNDDRPTDVTPPEFNVRTRVHEYGGGSYLVTGKTIFFSNFDDQRLYRQDGSAAPTPITEQAASSASLRYADARLTRDGGFLVCVRERHGTGDVANEIVLVPAEGSRPTRVIERGRDFYSSPRPSPDARSLAWLAWDHPYMPWERTELWVATVSPEGSLRDRRLVAGGGDESIFQPDWSPEGELHFVSDRTGWWNLYRERDGAVVPLAPVEREFGAPAWEFGLSTYAFLEAGRIACIFGMAHRQELGIIQSGTADIETLGLPFTSLQPTLQSDGRILVLLAGGPTHEPAVILVDGDRPARWRILRRGLDAAPEPGYISVPRHVEFPTDGGRTAHALFYPPTNQDFSPPPGERPPLVISVHGGPTSHASTHLNVGHQYWTSRGFALVDVNYGGSSGYGRAYRDRLEARWGITDVQDCVAAARYLVESGEVDAQRIVVRGASAGGYTGLCILAFHDVCAAGVSYYGVGDLELLIKETHKFESRYLDWLIGPYPEAADQYRSRSPIHWAKRISCPVILFQGALDDVVPPSQSEAIVRALVEQKIPHVYFLFEGEGHGFRRAETLQRALEAELDFLGRALGFEPQEPLPRDRSDDADATPTRGGGRREVSIVR